jgi:hypothetical protein
MTTHEADLDELLRLHGEATCGEWFFVSDTGEVWTRGNGKKSIMSPGHERVGIRHAHTWASGNKDLDFAVAAHNALPELIERVRRAETALETMRNGDRVARAEREALWKVARLAQQIADDYESGPVSFEPLIRALAKVPR